MSKLETTFLDVIAFSNLTVIINLFKYKMITRTFLTGILKYLLITKTYRNLHNPYTSTNLA